MKCSSLNFYQVKMYMFVSKYNALVVRSYMVLAPIQNGSDVVHSKLSPARWHSSCSHPAPDALLGLTAASPLASPQAAQVCVT